MNAQNQAIEAAVLAFLKHHILPNVELTPNNSDFFIGGYGQVEFLITSKVSVAALIDHLDEALNMRHDSHSTPHGNEFAYDLTSTRRVFVDAKYGEKIRIGCIDFNYGNARH